MLITRNTTQDLPGSRNTVQSLSEIAPREPARLLTTKEAARYLGVSTAFLERDRWAGARIPFVRVGSRAVRYSMAVLEAFVTGQTRTNTTDLGGGS